MAEELVHIGLPSQAVPSGTERNRSTRINAERQLQRYQATRAIECPRRAFASVDGGLDNCPHLGVRKAMLRR